MTGNNLSVRCVLDQVTDWQRASVRIELYWVELRFTYEHVARSRMTRREREGERIYSVLWRAIRFGSGGIAIGTGRRASKSLVYDILYSVQCTVYSRRLLRLCHIVYSVRVFCTRTTYTRSSLHKLYPYVMRVLDKRTRAAPKRRARTLNFELLPECGAPDLSLNRRQVGSCLMRARAMR